MSAAPSAARDGQTGRCLRIIEQLCAHAIEGMSNKELVAALGISPANASRDMALLAELGWAETLPNGRYAPRSGPCRSCGCISCMWPTSAPAPSNWSAA